MSTAVQTATLEKAERKPVLKALRKLGGRATVADVIAATGLARDRAEASLRALLEERRGHLEVGEQGTLVYRFEPSLIERGKTPLLERIRERTWKAFQTGFKIWIVVMLVVYFLIFLALLIGAMVAGQSRDGDGGGWGGGRRGGGHGHGGHFHFPSFWFWYLIWSPDWYWGRPYYGHRWEQKHGKKVKVPFYKKVFAFVFGPDRPKPTQEQKDRSVIRLIRARRGVLTVAELVQHTGLPREEAEEEMARLMVAHQGEPRVTDGGEIVYVFPELMVSAHGRVAEREPDPAWRRLEPKLEVTGNSTGTDVVVAGINGFNMVAAATAPFFIFPRLGIGGDAAWVGLVWVPLVFSVLFYSIPLARWWGVAKENVRRAAGNVRKVLLGYVYRTTLAGDEPQPVGASEAALHVREALSDEKVEPARVEDELVRLTAEFDGEVEVGPDGSGRYLFPDIVRQYAAGEAVRNRLALERQEVGEIVYASDETTEERGERDLADFDRELAAAASAEARPALDSEPEDLGRYIPAPDRVAYVDDFELVAFEEEMKARKRDARRVRV